MTTYKLGYSRKSTNKESQKFDRQNDQLLDYGCASIFQETISGRAATKPELEKMIAAFQEHKEQHPEDELECVVVSLDRLGRSTQNVLALIQRLDELGIGLTSLKEGFAANTPQSRFFLTIVAAFAELEVEMTRARVNEGLDAAKRRGTKLGRRPKNLDTAIRMYESNDYSVSEICKANGICRQTLYNHLKKKQAS